eukprot:Gb_30029 [translate_table: standard]
MPIMRSLLDPGPKGSTPSRVLGVTPLAGIRVPLPGIDHKTYMQFKILECRSEVFAQITRKSFVFEKAINCRDMGKCHTRRIVIEQLPRHAIQGHELRSLRIDALPLGLNSLLKPGNVSSISLCVLGLPYDSKSSSEAFPPVS